MDTFNPVPRQLISVLLDPQTPTSVVRSLVELMVEQPYLARVTLAGASHAQLSHLRARLLGMSEGSALYVELRSAYSRDISPGSAVRIQLSDILECLTSPGDVLSLFAGDPIRFSTVVSRLSFDERVMIQGCLDTAEREVLSLYVAPSALRGSLSPAKVVPVAVVSAALLVSLPALSDVMFSALESVALVTVTAEVVNRLAGSPLKGNRRPVQALSSAALRVVHHVLGRSSTLARKSRRVMLSKAGQAQAYSELSRRGLLR